MVVVVMSGYLISTKRVNHDLSNCTSKKNKRKLDALVGYLASLSAVSLVSFQRKALDTTTCGQVHQRERCSTCKQRRSQRQHMNFPMPTLLIPPL
jgi:hypothetical protein